MSAAILTHGHAWRADVEGSAVAVLVLALALARDALTADYTNDPDPLCPCIYAVDVVLHHIDGLNNALTRYRAVLDGDDRLPIPID